MFNKISFWPNLNQEIEILERKLEMEAKHEQ